MFAKPLTLIAATLIVSAAITPTTAGAKPTDPPQPLAVSCAAYAGAPFGVADPTTKKLYAMKADHEVECTGDVSNIANTVVRGYLYYNSTPVSTPSATGGPYGAYVQSYATYKSGCWYAATDGEIIYKNGTRKAISRVTSSCVTAP